MQKTITKFALFLLRKFGKKIRAPETPHQVFERRVSYLQELKDAGYLVDQKTPYQIRINNRLDVYPKNARWHDIKLNTRGGFQGRNLASFVRKYFNEF